MDIKDFNLPLDSRVSPIISNTVSLTPKYGRPRSVLRRRRLRHPRTTMQTRRAQERDRFSVRQWNDKAAGFVSYGGAGGARAVGSGAPVLAECKSPHRA